MDLIWELKTRKCRGFAQNFGADPMSMVPGREKNVFCESVQMATNLRGIFHKNVTKWVAMARNEPILTQNESYGLQEYFPMH